MELDCAIDITAEQRKTILTLLQRYLPSVEAWAYGSRVKWTSRPDSDLDLVVFAESKQKDQVVSLREAFNESGLPFRVDLFNWNEVPEIFHQAIEENHAVLVTRPPIRVNVNWREMPFSQAVQVNPKVQLDRGSIYPFVDMAAVNAGARSAFATEEREFKGGGSRFVDGDTLMARITPCLENGKIARYSASKSTSPAHGSTEFIVVRGRPDETDDGFSYYLTQWDTFREYAIGQMTGTSGRQRVPVDSLDHIIVPVPPLTEQRAIAHTLGVLDDKIELNKRMNETLEAMARALFKSWFVDFDPVHAKIEGRSTGLPRHIADLFPDRLIDSDIGEIPEGWSIRSLGEIVETIRGRSYRSKELTDSKVALVTLKSFARGGGYRPDGLKSFSGTYKISQIVQPGEIVVACTDVTQKAEVIGRPAIVQESPRFERLVASLDTLIVRPKEKSISRAFLYLLMKEERFAAHTYAHCTGTTVLHLTKSGVPSFRSAMPQPQLMNSFNEFTNQLLCRVAVTRREADNLVILRDALLPRLISGETKIRDAEKLIGAVA